MNLLVILLSIISLTLTSGFRLTEKQHSEPKWKEIVHYEYRGPPAPLSKDGRVIDTPEVAEAKANHLLIHAETAADLSKKMADAHTRKVESEAKIEDKIEETEKSIVTSMQITSKLMAMLMAAVAEEEQLEQHKNDEKVLEIPVLDIKKEDSPVSTAEQDQKLQSELQKLEDTKPIFEPEVHNEIGEGQPITVLQKNYEGPLAPLGVDGRVVDTLEVKMAKDMHNIAYKELARLSKSQEQPKEKDTDEHWENTSHNSHKNIFLPPVHLLWPADGPIGYDGPAAPIGNNGRVVDTMEVKKAKLEHQKAHEHANAIAKRHPPKVEDNSL